MGWKKTQWTGRKSTVKSLKDSLSRGRASQYSLKKNTSKKESSEKEIWEMNPFALQRKLEAMEEFGFISCAMCKEAFSCQSEVTEHYWFEHQKLATAVWYLTISF